MTDITIPLPAPAERAAVTPKQFNELYINKLSVRAESIGPADTICVQYSPFDKATGERLEGDYRVLVLPFWETVEAVPEAAAAFAAVAAAVPVLIARYEATLP